MGSCWKFKFTVEGGIGQGTMLAVEVGSFPIAVNCKFPGIPEEGGWSAWGCRGGGNGIFNLGFEGLIPLPLGPTEVPGGSGDGAF